MDRPLISVIIPSYNSARFVDQAIDSALAQTYRPLEIIVVDDGSTDTTAEVLAPYGDRIRCVRQENRGLAGARNTGLREARGELFAFLDADDRWVPEKLALQWEYLRDHPDVALVHSDLFYVRNGSDQTIRREVGRARFVGDCYGQLFLECRVLPSSVLLRRECVERVGYFDEAFRITEDLDLWLRLARYHPFGYVDQPLVFYRLHDANLTLNDAGMRRGELRVLEKALAADPNLVGKVGKPALRRKLHDMYFTVGYHHFEQSEFAAARKHFAKALAYRWLSPYLAALWTATWLPPSITGAFRLLKRRMFSSK